MTLRGWMPTALAVTLIAAFATPSVPAPPGPWVPPPAPHAARPDSLAAGPGRGRGWVNDQPDTGQFLPDTALLARVGDRTIPVSRYVESYFNSYAEFRPRPDSAGRVEFLKSMINKEVLGLTALAVERPFSFEDRVTMREHRQRVLSNVLYQRAIMDSVTVSEDETRRLYEQHKYALHLRHIEFPDRATANRVRGELVAGRTQWKAAVRTYSTAPDSDRARNGDLGWVSRRNLDPVLASEVFPLAPGEFSPVLRDAQGYQVVQVVERRPETPPYYQDLRPVLRDEIRNVKIAARGEAIQATLRGEIGMTYDTTSIEWAASRFAPTLSSGREGAVTTLEINAGLPEFSPADTGRVLARHRYGRFSLGGFLDSYNTIPPMMRPNVNDFESMRAYLDGVILEPYMAEMAVQRGLDKDPLAVQQLEQKREEILVEHMYADSITSKIWIRPEDRRKYYQEHLTDYYTYPRVKFAAFVRGSRAAADSLADRLRAGVKAEDLLRADSLLGQSTGSIQERSANDKGSPYYKLLFEELRPGKVAVDGPDRQGDYAVIQLLSFDPGRQLRYEEVEHLVDESLQNIRAEEKLKEFIARRSKLYRIEAHPELLNRVRLVDPTLTED